MPSETDEIPPVNRPVPVAEIQAIRLMAIEIAAQVSLARAIDMASAGLAVLLNAPVALLSRDQLAWRFESHAFPAPSSANALMEFRAQTTSDPFKQLQDESGKAWTAIGLGTLGARDWALLLPGQSTAWAGSAEFEQLIEQVSRSLGLVANKELAEYANRFQRRLHRFNLRLARERDREELATLVLQTLASQVRAQTGALALYEAAEDSLAIVATKGYPLSIVEHLRIRPDDGVLGRTFKSGKAIVGQPNDESVSRRLRYRTDSYMVLPIMTGSERFGVIALTDRADGGRFDARDFAAARLMASSAAPVFSRERLRDRLHDLTELATVDPVTHLFNRRYFEARLEAEVERARRQGQELALLLIDIDDFKRVNDTRGHLEGDRVLREVGDLLHAGVRIFDVCARYGGEEFVIVMPAASVAVAQQVAERIRARIERAFSNDSPAVTASVGVGMLADAATADELVDIADRALIAAKKAGKNMVWNGGTGVRRLR
jgi:diguanylate cyclase (GGDEF)-like protein